MFANIYKTTAVTFLDSRFVDFNKLKKKKSPLMKKTNHHVSSATMELCGVTL